MLELDGKASKKFIILQFCQFIKFQANGIRRYEEAMGVPRGGPEFPNSFFKKIVSTFLNILFNS